MIYTLSISQVTSTQYSVSLLRDLMALLTGGLQEAKGALVYLSVIAYHLAAKRLSATPLELWL